MSRMSGHGLHLAGLLLLIPGIALAQARGGAVAVGGHAAAGAPVATHAGAASVGTMHTGTAVGAPRTAGAASSVNHYVYARNSAGQLVLRRSSSMTSATRNRGVSGVHSGVSAAHRRSTTADDSAVPGLGFDYSHVAATRPGGVHGRRDRDRGFNDGAILFPYGGGYFVPTGTDVIGDGGDVPVAEEDQPEDQ